MAVIRIHDSYSDTNTHWVALDHLNLPRYWAAIWSFYRSSELADSTLLKQLSYLDSFYCFSDEIEYAGALDDAIADIDIKVLGRLLEAYFIHLQNKQPINDATCKKWETAFKFLKDSLFWISKNAQNYQNFFETESKIRSLETLYGQLRIGTNKTQETIRSIPINLIEYLVEILDPTHPKNPFRNASSKWRVYVVFNLLLYLGLRKRSLRTSYHLVPPHTRHCSTCPGFSSCWQFLSRWHPFLQASMRFLCSSPWLNGTTSKTMRMR